MKEVFETGIVINGEEHEWTKLEGHNVYVLEMDMGEGTFFYGGGSDVVLHCNSHQESDGSTMWRILKADEEIETREFNIPELNSIVVSVHGGKEDDAEGIVNVLSRLDPLTIPSRPNKPSLPLIIHRNGKVFESGKVVGRGSLTTVDLEDSRLYMSRQSTDVLLRVPDESIKLDVWYNVTSLIQAGDVSTIDVSDGNLTEDIVFSRRHARFGDDLIEMFRVAKTYK